MDDPLERLSDSNSAEHYSGTAGYFLYQTKSSIYPFVKFSEQLSQINDYCLYILTCLNAKVQEFQAYGEAKWDETISWEQREFLSWSFLYQDINKYTLLLLLLAFLESSLNEIAAWFSEETGCLSTWKKIRNPKVSDYIVQIGKCCQVDLLSAVTEELMYYDTVRKVRNQFVHNEWEQITDRYDQFILADVIDMISWILAKVEHSALISGLIQ